MIRKRSIPRSKSLEKLVEIIGQIKGCRCQRLAFGYGGEVHLYLTRTATSRGSARKPTTAEQWILNTCGTPWQLMAPKRVIRSADGDLSELEKGLQAVLRKKLVEDVGVVVPSNDLSIRFNESCWFQIAPTAEDDRHSDVPYWELFAPDHMLLAYGPGNSWTYKPSDVPSG